MRFKLSNMSDGYLELVHTIQRDGRKRSPRGQPTYELPYAQVELTDPRYSHPVDIGRKYSPAIAAAEAACLIGGVADPQLMISAGSNFVRFLDGGNLHGAYGPRIRAQLPRVVQRLRADNDTRQAILQIWDPLYDLGGWTPKDLPCTIGFQFAIYQGRLEMRTKMRSNDIWWGVAHDFPMFTALQITVADALGLELGSYFHEADSLHIYERDLDAAGELHPAEGPERKVGGGFYAQGGIEQGMERARCVVEGEELTMPTTSERWYEHVLADHVHAAQQSRMDLA